MSYLFLPPGFACLFVCLFSLRLFYYLYVSVLQIRAFFDENVIQSMAFSHIALVLSHFEQTTISNAEESLCSVIPGAVHTYILYDRPERVHHGALSLSSSSLGLQIYVHMYNVMALAIATALMVQSVILS